MYRPLGLRFVQYPRVHELPGFYFQPFLLQWLTQSGLVTHIFFLNLRVSPRCLLKCIHFALFNYMINNFLTLPPHRRVNNGQCTYCRPTEHWKCTCPALLMQGIFEDLLIHPQNFRDGRVVNLPWRQAFAFKCGKAYEQLARHQLLFDPNVAANWGFGWCIVQRIHLALHNLQ